MAFDPTTLFPGAAGDRQGEVFEIRPENLWQDKAGTVAVTTDGDPVKRIDGISVNGHYLVMMGTNEWLVYHTDGTVHWLTGAGGDWDIMWSDGNSWSFMNNAPYAVGCAVSLHSPSAGEQFFFGTMPSTASGQNNSVVHLGARTGTTATIAHWNNDQDFTHTFPTASAERHICEYLNPGSEYTIDGLQIDVSGTTPSAIDEIGNITFFGRNRESTVDAGEGMDGDIYGMIVVIDTLTAQEKADIDEWLQEQIEGPPAGETGSGSLQASTATISGTGTRVVTGSGSLQASTATISGAGTVAREGSGALQASTATVDGSGTLTEAPVEISHVGSTKVTNDAFASLDVDKPAGAVEGDVALIVATVDDGSNTITLPAGFTTIHDGVVPSSAVGNKIIKLGFKVLGASEPSSYTVSFATADDAAVSCHVWRDVNTSNVQDVAFAFTTLDSGVDPMPDCPSVTTVTDGAALVTIVSDGRGPAFEDMDFENYYQPPAGTTEVIDANYNAGSNYTGHAVGWEIIETAGATGVRDWANIDDNDGGFAGSLTLRPAVESAPTGSGALQAGTATVSGAGVVSREATGALQAQQATISGSGTREVTGSGAVQAGQATVDGAGDVSSPAIITGDGALQAQQATVSGSGTREVTGAGTVAAQVAQVAGTGIRVITGSGILQAQQASAAGAGGPLITGAGAVQAQQATMTGEGTVAAAIRTGEGDLQAQPATVSAVVVRTVKGSGTMVANAASVDGRPWIEHHSADATWADASTPGSTWTNQSTPGSTWEDQ